MTLYKLSMTAPCINSLYVIAVVSLSIYLLTPYSYTNHHHYKTITPASPHRHTPSCWGGVLPTAITFAAAYPTGAGACNDVGGPHLGHQAAGGISPYRIAISRVEDNAVDDVSWSGTQIVLESGTSERGSGSVQREGHVEGEGDGDAEFKGFLMWIDIGPDDEHIFFETERTLLTSADGSVSHTARDNSAIGCIPGTTITHTQSSPTHSITAYVRHPPTTQLHTLSSRNTTSSSSLNHTNSMTTYDSQSTATNGNPAVITQHLKHRNISNSSNSSSSSSSKSNMHLSYSVSEPAGDSSDVVVNAIVMVNRTHWWKLTQPLGLSSIRNKKTGAVTGQGTEGGRGEESGVGGEMLIGCYNMLYLVGWVLGSLVFSEFVWKTVGVIL
eukprot:GHVQ01011253.1.p1 GENE.GHVQ01011253.1~~GHVQ01011253.1.p1  ORF type:complete len:384 (-),score=86.77 GHVQ01011253.1:115-1266(-)